jgi:hypothetical protein
LWQRPGAKQKSPAVQTVGLFVPGKGYLVVIGGIENLFLLLEKYEDFL